MLDCRSISFMRSRAQRSAHSSGSVGGHQPAQLPGPWQPIGITQSTSPLEFSLRDCMKIVHSSKALSEKLTWSSETRKIRPPKIRQNSPNRVFYLFARHLPVSTTMIRFEIARKHASKPSRGVATAVTSDRISFQSAASALSLEPHRNASCHKPSRVRSSIQRIWSSNQCEPNVSPSFGL